MLAPYQTCGLQTLSPIPRAAFHVGDGLLRCEEAVTLREPHLFVFALVACASRVTPPKTAETPVQELPAGVFF